MSIGSLFPGREEVSSFDGIKPGARAVESAPDLPRHRRVR